MIDLPKIQNKWQKRWSKDKIFKVKEDPKMPKYYCLEMFPYPSGYLHMGHVRNYSIGDAFARYKRMQGFNVLYPMGYDSFGLPAENAAIKKKVDPSEWTLKNIEGIKAQQQLMGLSYDWDRMVATCLPDYYKWNQWIFLQFLEKGIAYKKKSFVNWCPKCNTVLANEQVHDGKCWRCSSNVDQKNLEQWFFKITDYAQELLDDLDKLKDWPERVKTMQKNWIGRSEGVEIFFKLEDSDQVLSTFTTRCDTIFSVTFLVIAPEHPLVMELVKGTKYEKETKKVVSQIRKQTEIERTTPEGKDKIGCFLGRYVINPVNGEKVPIYVANFALMYGTGIVMADAHDQRDFEFARKYDIPLKFVISDDGAPINADKATRAYLSDGILFNSGEFSGMNNREALPDMANWLEEKKWGKKKINFKLKDWLISRQRYWGTPIPVVYCDKCGLVPVPEEELPVLLPKDVKFTGRGNPLETSRMFTECECYKCGGKARRETDTMDTFVDSSWYFLRYCSPKADKVFDKAAVKYWMPVDQYIGGIEHACMHLIYARFFTKALRDLNLLHFDEPFTRLLTQGMVLKDGAKMSKSLGNTVDPGEIINKYGSDTARLFILFAALPEKELEWSDQGVAGSFRFLNKVWYLLDPKPKFSKDMTDRDKRIVGKLHRTIKKVSQMIEEFKLSLAIGSLMEFVNALAKYKEKPVNEKVWNDSINNLALLLCPFTPHLAEELWEKQKQKGYVSLGTWPQFDETMIDLKAEVSEEMVENTINDVRSVLKLAKMDKPDEIILFISAKWKFDFYKKVQKQLKKTFNVGEIIRAVMDKKHGKDISKLVPKLVKDPARIPTLILDQTTELDVLKQNIDLFKEEFDTKKVAVFIAEDSIEAKANIASPGKPAILVK